MTAAAWDVLGHAFIMEQIRGGAGQSQRQRDLRHHLAGFRQLSLRYGLLRLALFDQTPRELHARLEDGRQRPERRRGTVAGQGTVAHNGVWGADYIAHVSSLTIGDPAHGYVIAKAAMLEQIYAGFGVWASMQLDGEAYLPLVSSSATTSSNTPSTSRSGKWTPASPREWSPRRPDGTGRCSSS